MLVKEGKKRLLRAENIKNRHEPWALLEHLSRPAFFAF